MTKEEASIANLPLRPSGRILRAGEARAWQDGYSFLDASRRQAERMLDTARRAAMLQYAQGYENGMAQGEAEAARLVSETVVKVDRYLGGLEREVINLSLDMVRRMLGEFDVNELVAKAARQAIAEIRRGKYLKVSVHPNAADLVRDQLGTILGGSDLGLRVEIDTDKTLAADACILSTDVAVVDASIDAQLKAIAVAVAPKAEAQR